METGTNPATPPAPTAPAQGAPPTAADPNGANQGNGAAPDAPAQPSKNYSEAELQYLIVKRTEKLHAEIEALKAEANKAKPKEKSAEEKLYEKFVAEHTPKLEAAEKARREAEERADQVELRDFATSNMGTVFNRDVALAILGLPFAPGERLAKRDGKIVVLDSDGTVMPHRDPAKWVKERLDSKEYDFTRPSAGGGGGKTPALPSSSQQQTEQKTLPPPVVRHLGDAKTLARQILREKQAELDAASKT